MRATVRLLAGTAVFLLAVQMSAGQDDIIGGAAAQPGGEIVFRTAIAEDEDPAAAGKAAALALKQAMGDVEPQIVLVAECFEDRPNKGKVLEGIAAVFGRERLCGGACYGMFTQDGVEDLDAVALLGIGGEGVSVSAALVKDMGAAGLSLEGNEQQLTEALNRAGERLARKTPGLADADLLILIVDAHSPKNQLLLDGVQSVTGKAPPVTGGCVNKNAGQNWVYFGGQPYTDGAVAIALTGDFSLAMSGRQAQDNDAVIATAQESATEALRKLGTEPFALLAFDCAGRMGKLDDASDELAAIQRAVGTEVPLFGCYCAGEFGPTTTEDAETGVCYGRGWHVMVSALGR